MLLRKKALEPRRRRLVLAAGLLLMSSGLALRAMGAFGPGPLGDFSQGVLLGTGLGLELVAVLLGRRPG